MYYYSKIRRLSQKYIDIFNILTIWRSTKLKLYTILVQSFGTTVLFAFSFYLQHGKKEPPVEHMIERTGACSIVGFWWLFILIHLTYLFNFWVYFPLKFNTVVDVIYSVVTRHNYKQLTSKTSNLCVVCICISRYCNFCKMATSKETADFVSNTV